MADIRNIKASPVNPKSEVAIRRTMQKTNRMARIMTRLIQKVRGLENTSS